MIKTWKIVCYEGAREAWLLVNLWNSIAKLWWKIPEFDILSRTKFTTSFTFLKHPVPCTARLQRTRNIKKVTLATAEKVWFCGRFSPRKNSEFRALTKSALKSRENMTSRTYVCAKNVCIQAFSESILGVKRGGVLELQPSVCFWDAIKYKATSERTKKPVTQALLSTSSSTLFGGDASNNLVSN